MRTFSATPIEMLTSLWRNRQPINASARRELLGRYRGYALGLLRSFFNPLFTRVRHQIPISPVFADATSAKSSTYN